MRWLRVAACSLGAACAAGTVLAEGTRLAREASPAPAASETRQAIRGTGVSLVVPAGFRASVDFPGIGRPEDLSSVMVTTLDVPLSIAADAFTAKALAQRAMELVSTTPVVVDGRQAARIEATQRIGSMSFRKWFVLLGNETRSVLLTATTPSDLEAQHRDALVGVLESARWDEASRPAGAAPALSFRVIEVPPLRIVRSAEDSIVLSEPEAAKGRVAPVVAVGASRARVEVGDLAVFAKARLQETVSIDEIAVESEKARPLGSLEGHQIDARARDTQSGRAVRVHQILASDGARYYLVQGIFDAEDDARLAPSFEALAASFALRPAAAATAGGSTPAP